MRISDNAPANRAGNVRQLHPGCRPSKLLDALEAENAQLRASVATLALEAAILREQLQPD